MNQQDNWETRSIADSVQTFKSDEEDQNLMINNGLEEMIDKPVINWENFKIYFITRFTQLFPSKQSIAAKKHLLNPLPGLRMIGFKQWLMILSAFLAWS